MNIVAAEMETLYNAYDMYTFEAWIMFLPGVLLIVFLIAAFRFNGASTTKGYIQKQHFR